VIPYWAAHRCCTGFSLVEEVHQSHYRAHLYQKSEEAQILLRALIEAEPQLPELSELLLTRKIVATTTAK
jgi:hypothetical protein